MDIGGTDNAPPRVCNPMQGIILAIPTLQAESLNLNIAADVPSSAQVRGTEPMAVLAALDTLMALVSLPERCDLST